MASKEFSQELSLQASLSSGSSSLSSSSPSSSSVNSQVDGSPMNDPALEVSRIKTSHVDDEEGDDGGSDNEGFLSGEEEFESAVDRPIVGYPDEETIEKPILGEDNDGSFVSYSEFSTPVSIRPIAKVSVDTDDDDGYDDEDNVSGSSRVNESVGKMEGVVSEVAEEVDLPEIKVNEVENEEEKGEKEILISREVENSGVLVNESGVNDVQEERIEFSEDSKGGKLLETSLAEDVSSVPEESVDAVKPVLELNDVTVKQKNEVSDGEQEAEINEGTEKRADGGVKLNVDVAVEDGEQLNNLETDASVDDKGYMGEQINSNASELADESSSEVLDEKNLHVKSPGSGTAAVADMEEIKGSENSTVNSVHGGAKLDNGFDNVGHEDDEFVAPNFVVSNSEIASNMLEMDNEVATEEGLHEENVVIAGIAGIAEDEDSGAMGVEVQQHDGLGASTVDEQTNEVVTEEGLHEENVVIAGIAEDEESGAMGMEVQQHDGLGDSTVDEQTLDSKDRDILTDDVKAKSSDAAESLVKETILISDSEKDVKISDTPEIIEPVSNEEDEEEHHFVEEGDIEGSVSDGETEGAIFDNSEAAKQFLEELERGSGTGSHSGADSSHDNSQRIDGQIVTDSDEVDTEDEGDGKELFDSAALAALLKAARDAGSDGAPITVSAQDGSRLFSIERPAGLGSSLSSARNASRPGRPLSFTSSNPGVGDDSENKLSEEEKNKLQKLQQLRVNFLRLVQRLGVSLDDSLVAQVLYRFGLVAGRSTGQLFSFDSAKNTAIQLEAEGKEDVNFSLNILVLGKSGVGKSATINSIFGEDKTPINAFGPGTTMVKEIVGVVDGVKLRIFDSPGLRSSSSERSINHKILSSIKNVMKKSPPDIVLYVDRLDNQTRDLNDLLLLRSISSSLGSSIWKNAIITLTHAASAPPDGPSGSPLGYEVFVAQRSHVLQQTVAQAVGDLRILNPTLMNPVSLVENHPSCRKNRDGQKVLPNGQSWRPQLLLLCYSIKILADVGNLSKTPEAFDHRKLFGLRTRSPPLPYLLSGLLQSRAHPKLPSDQAGDNGDSDIDLADLSDSDGEEEEDEYDQLPPFKPLRKSQIAKLSKAQRKAYFEEYDYRVKLLQKKQWKEELKRMRDFKKKGQPSADEYGYLGDDDDQENGSPAAVQVPLPDMALPPSFDGDNPAFRYRFLEPTSQFLARPVLDTHGWDHDCGYDGVNLEQSMAIVGRFPAAVAVQITKDKKEFNIHLDSSVSAKHGENGSTMAGFDIQNIGRQLAYIIRGETKFKNFRKNKTAAGISVTFLGDNVCTGFKLEDQIALGKRVVLVGSTGTVRSQGDSAFGVNLEMRLRESDFPIGQDQSSLGLSLVKWRGDMALGANFQSQFSVGRSYKMAVRAGLNNKLTGQISVKTSSSDQLQIALMAILPVARAIYNSLRPGVAEAYSSY